jgi:hypothetical protein
VRHVAALALAVAGWLWLIDANPFSGPVLITFGPGHGIHALDVLTLIPWAMALWLMRTPARVPAVVRLRRR